MAEIVAVVPLYKTGTAFPLAVAEFVAQRTDPVPALFLDLISGGGAGASDASRSLQELLDEIAALGAAEVALAWADGGYDGTRVVASNASELADRPFAVEALTTFARHMRSLGVNVVACLPWWVAAATPDTDLFEAVLADPDVRTVGVCDVVSNAEIPSVAIMVEAAQAVSRDHCTFVASVGSHVDRGSLPNVLTNTSRTFQLPDDWAGAMNSRSASLARHLALSSAAPPVVALAPDLAAALTNAMSGSGLTMPFIPAERASGLRDLMAPELVASYAFGERMFDPVESYLFREPVNDIIEGNWRPRLEISASGHGVNSFAHSYTLVVPGLAVLAQVGYGLLYEDGETAGEWTDLMHQVEGLYAAVRSSRLPESGQLLVVVASRLRDDLRCGLLRPEDGPPERREALKPTEDPFAAATEIVHALAGGSR